MNKTREKGHREKKKREIHRHTEREIEKERVRNGAVFFFNLESGIDHLKNE